MRSPVTLRTHRQGLVRRLRPTLAVLAAILACLASAPAEPAATPMHAPVAVQPGFVPGQPAPVLLERGRLLLAFARQWVC